ncbi:hypothetical protein Chor_015193 [Crotalus horridus]
MEGSLEKVNKNLAQVVDPTLAEMGKNLSEAMKLLEDNHRKVEEENEKNYKRKDIPGPLQGSGQDMVSILQFVQTLMHGDEEEESLQLQNVGEQGHMALLGHSLAAYISILDRDRLRKLTTKILSDTTLWLCRLFRFENGSAYYHEDDREGLLKVCKLGIHSCYDDYATEGFNALYNKQPVVYISAAARTGLGQFLCSQAATKCDSMTLTLGPWLGLPAVPAVTLYRQEDPSLSLAAGLTSSQVAEKLRALSLWLSLQYLGHDGIVERIKHASQLSQRLLENLKNQDFIRTSVEDEFSSPVVVFKFSPEKSHIDQMLQAAQLSAVTGNEGDICDTFNQWLGEQLAQLVPASGVDLVDLEDEGTCVRFSPLMTSAGPEFGAEKNCIYIGMVNEDLDVPELVETIAASGREIEENSKLLENMTEVVRKGIQDAQAQLQKANEERLLEENPQRQRTRAGRNSDGVSETSSLSQAADLDRGEFAASPVKPENAEPSSEGMTPCTQEASSAFPGTKAQASGIDPSPSEEKESLR